MTNNHSDRANTPTFKRKRDASISRNVNKKQSIAWREIRRRQSWFYYINDGDFQLCSLTRCCSKSSLFFTFRRWRKKFTIGHFSLAARRWKIAVNSESFAKVHPFSHDEKKKQFALLHRRQMLPGRLSWTPKGIRNAFSRASQPANRHKGPFVKRRHKDIFI